MSVKQKVEELRELLLKEYGVEPNISIDVNFHDVRDEEDSRKLVSDIASKHGVEASEGSYQEIHWYEAHFGVFKVGSFYDKEDEENVS